MTTKGAEELINLLRIENFPSIRLYYKVKASEDQELKDWYSTKGQNLSDDQALEFLAVEQTVPEQQSAVIYFETQSRTKDNTLAETKLIAGKSLKEIAEQNKEQDEDQIIEEEDNNNDASESEESEVDSLFETEAGGKPPLVRIVNDKYYRRQDPYTTLENKKKYKYKFSSSKQSNLNFPTMEKQIVCEDGETTWVIKPRNKTTFKIEDKTVE